MKRIVGIAFTPEDRIHVERIGQYSGPVNGVAVHGDDAYVGPRVLVLDATDPAHPAPQNGYGDTHPLRYTDPYNHPASHTRLPAATGAMSAPDRQAREMHP